MNKYVELLLIEWMKIKKYKAFWLTFSILLVTYPAINYLVYFAFNFKAKTGNSQEVQVMKMLFADPFTFPMIWQSVAYFSSFFVLVPTFLVVMLVCNEFSFKTHRQNIIDGLNRSQFITAKIIDVVIIAFLSALIAFVVAAIFGLVNDKNSMTNFFEGSYFIALYFVQLIAQLSIAFLLALLLRKAFITIAVVFFLMIADNIGASILTYHKNPIANFLPFEMSDRIVPIPTSFIRIKIKQDTNEAIIGTIPYQFAYTLFFIAIIWFVAFKFFENRDL